MANGIPVECTDAVVTIDPANKKIEFRFATPTDASAVVSHATAAKADEFTDLVNFMMRLIV